MASPFDSERKSFTFTWILENYEHCEQKTGEFLRSPTFIVDNIDRTKWSLSIYPRGVVLENWISLYLNREEDSKGPATIEVDYEFAFLAPDGSVLTSEVVQKAAFVKNACDGFPEFEERDPAVNQGSRFLPLAELTIRCRLWNSNGKVKIDGQCVARTCIGMEKKVFLWKIRNIYSLMVGQEMTYILKSISDDKAIMTLKLFLRKDRSSRAIVIKFVLSDYSTRFSTFKSYLVDAQGDRKMCGQQELRFSPTVRSKECVLSLSLDMLMDNNSLYLPDDALHLYCEKVFSIGTVFEGIEGTVYECLPSFIVDSLVPEHLKTADVKKSNTSLKGDLHSMLQENILCDVKLCAEPRPLVTPSETFPAHRFMLSARSPVFRAMFQSDTNRKSIDRIIMNAKPDTVRRMLAYMYTNRLEGLDSDTAYDLYMVAVEYKMMTLKDKCASFLKSKFSTANLCNVCLGEL